MAFKPWLDGTQDVGMPDLNTPAPTDADTINDVQSYLDAPKPDSPSAPKQMDPKVRQYMMDKYFQAADRKGVKAAQDKAKMLGAVGVGAQALSLATQGNTQPQVFKKGWNETGRPQMSEAYEGKVDTSPLTKAGEQGVKNAEVARQAKIQDFEMGNKLETQERDDYFKDQDLGLKRDKAGLERNADARATEKHGMDMGEAKAKAVLDDPTSEVSKRAQMLYQSSLFAKAKEADAAGDHETANAIRAQAKDAGGLSANQAGSLYKSMQGLDYKDVLNNNAAMARTKLAEAGADRRAKLTAEKAGQKDVQQVFANTKELRNEYNSHPTTKTTSGLLQGAQTVFQAAKNPSPAGDMSLIYGYMKAMDPGSTVREGEFQTAGESGGLPTKIQVMYNRLKSGERLTPEQRADFVAQTKHKVQGQLQLQKDLDARYKSLADKNGLDFGQVGDDSVYQYGDQAPDAPAKQGAASKPKTVTQNGHTYILNEATGEYE